MTTAGPIPTQHQQTTALIILGMIGAEFCEGGKPKRRPASGHDSSKRGTREHEAMDQAVARVTAKTLQVYTCTHSICLSGATPYMYIQNSINGQQLIPSHQECHKYRECHMGVVAQL